MNLGHIGVLLLFLLVFPGVFGMFISDSFQEIQTPTPELDESRSSSSELVDSLVNQLQGSSVTADGGLIDIYAPDGSIRSLQVPASEESYEIIGNEKFPQSHILLRRNLSKLKIEFHEDDVRFYRGKEFISLIFWYNGYPDLEMEKPTDDSAAVGSSATIGSEIPLADSPEEAKAKRIIESFGGKILQDYVFVEAVAFNISQSKLSQIVAALRSQFSGSDIEVDSILHLYLDESVDEIIKPVKREEYEAENGSLTGKGITIAVLDTGVDLEHPDLDDLDDNPSTDDPKILDVKSFVEILDNDGNPTDEFESIIDGHGHGTHVAGTAAGTGEKSNYEFVGVAPQANLLIGKVCGAAGSCDESAVAAGIEWAGLNGADVINMSLGGEKDVLIGSAVNQVLGYFGAITVAAVGNNGKNGYYTVGYPGGFNTVIGVGATDADFSSRGLSEDRLLKPDIVAPGVDICAPSSSGAQVMTDDCADGYVTASGTSMASPHVAGAVALILQKHPEWDFWDVRSALVSSTENHQNNALIDGGGQVDVINALNSELFFGSPNVAIFSSGEEKTSSFKLPKSSDKKIGYAISDVTVYNVKNEDSVELRGVEQICVEMGEQRSIDFVVTESFPLGLYQGYFGIKTFDDCVFEDAPIGNYSFPIAVSKMLEFEIEIEPEIFSDDEKNIVSKINITALSGEIDPDIVWIWVDPIYENYKTTGYTDDPILTLAVRFESGIDMFGGSWEPRPWLLTGSYIIKDFELSPDTGKIFISEKDPENVEFDYSEVKENLRSTEGYIGDRGVLSVIIYRSSSGPIPGAVISMVVSMKCNSLNRYGNSENEFRCGEKPGYDDFRFKTNLFNYENNKFENVQYEIDLTGQSMDSSPTTPHLHYYSFGYDLGGYWSNEGEGLYYYEANHKKVLGTPAEAGVPVGTFAANLRGFMLAFLGAKENLRAKIHSNYPLDYAKYNKILILSFDDETNTHASFVCDPKNEKSCKPMNDTPFLFYLSDWEDRGLPMIENIITDRWERGQPYNPFVFLTANNKESLFGADIKKFDGTPVDYSALGQASIKNIETGEEKRGQIHEFPVESIKIGADPDAKSFSHLEPGTYELKIENSTFIPEHPPMCYYVKFEYIETEIPEWPGHYEDSLDVLEEYNGTWDTETETCSPYEPSECLDSDGGFNLDERGTATVVTEEGVERFETDSCTGAWYADSILEWFCNSLYDRRGSGGGITQVTETICLDGCSEGKCLNFSTTKPDLRAYGLSAWKRNPDNSQDTSPIRVGDRVAIDIYVMNYGAAFSEETELIKVQVFENDFEHRIGFFDVPKNDEERNHIWQWPPYNSGGRGWTRWLDWIPTQSGTYQIIGYVDDIPEIDEEVDEKNNFLITEVEVLPKGGSGLFVLGQSPYPLMIALVVVALVLFFFAARGMGGKGRAVLNIC